MRKIISLIMFFCVFLITGLAFAGDSVVESTTQDLTNLLIPIVGGALLWLLKNGASWVKSKTGINVDALSRSIAEQAYRYVEELAHRKLKEFNTMMSWQQKETAGIAWIDSNMKRLGLATKHRDMVISYLMAEVNRARVYGMRSLEDAAKKLAERAGSLEKTLEKIK